MGNSAGREVEVKLAVRDRAALRRLLKRLKARGGPRMHEMNTLYDTPVDTLAREGKLVRVRVLTPAEPARAGRSGAKRARHAAQAQTVLTYKGPVEDEGREAESRYKVREEHELRVADGGALVRVFEGMGLRACFRYEKYRTAYRLPRVAGLVVELDETPIGDYLELEGDAAAIDRGAAMLGYAREDYISKSYGQLFLEQLQAAAGGGLFGKYADMMFARRR